MKVKIAAVLGERRLLQSTLTLITFPPSLAVRVAVAGTVETAKRVIVAARLRSGFKQLSLERVGSREAILGSLSSQLEAVAVAVVRRLHVRTRLQTFRRGWHSAVAVAVAVVAWFKSWRMVRSEFPKAARLALMEAKEVHRSAMGLRSGTTVSLWRPVAPAAAEAPEAFLSRPPEA